eukprot:868078-Pyramimonas_sp.AAC.1
MGSPNSLPPNPVGGGSPRGHVESLEVPGGALPDLATAALDLGEHPGVTVEETDRSPPRHRLLKQLDQEYSQLRRPLPRATRMERGLDMAWSALGHRRLKCLGWLPSVAIACFLIPLEIPLSSWRQRSWRELQKLPGRLHRCRPPCRAPDILLRLKPGTE